MKCYVFCSSFDCNIDFLKNIDYSDSFIIAADGGVNIVEALGLKPDLWVGDMDSSEKKDFLNTQKIIFPQNKDLTDAHIAALEAIKRNIYDIYFIGATGGRLDHEFANYCLLKALLKKGAFGTILNENNKIFMTDKSMKILPCGKKYISFFPFGGNVEKFTVKNAKYNLENYNLTDDLTYTVSNEFICDKSIEIEFQSGYVLVMCSDNAG